MKMRAGSQAARVPIGATIPSVKGVRATVGELLGSAYGELKRARVDSFHLTAELLMAHALGWDRVRVLAHPREPVSESVERGFRELVSRLSGGEPLQYLTGVQEFYGRSFRVTPAVLIPRPETELLVEKAIQLARNRQGVPCRIADVGTGSGCIAVSIACEIAACEIVAVDISPDALTVARGNARRLAERRGIGFVCGDLLESFPRKPIFDLILSNPPYVPRNDGQVAARVRDHEPHVALFGGEDGLDFYVRLAPQAAQRLLPGGWLVMEMGYSQSREVRRILHGAGFAVVEAVDDLRGIPRCVVARRTDG